MKLGKLTRNPWAIIGLAALGGWLVGSGVFALPFALPHRTAAAPSTSTPGPAGLPASRSSAAQLAQTSATMPTPSAGADPFSGFDL